MKRTVRKACRYWAPVGTRCRLCKLEAATHEGDGGVFEIKVMYGGEAGADEGNELAVLERRSWLCDRCITAVLTAWEADER